MTKAKKKATSRTFIWIFESQSISFEMYFIHKTVSWDVKKISYCKHWMVFSKNLNHGIAGIFWRTFYIYVWQSFLVNITFKDRPMVGSPRPARAGDNNMVLIMFACIGCWYLGTKIFGWFHAKQWKNTAILAGFSCWHSNSIFDSTRCHRTTAVIKHCNANLVI